MNQLNNPKVAAAGAIEILFSIAAGLAVLAVIIATSNRAAPPLQDYPEWMFQGWLLKALWLGDPHTKAIVQFAAMPVPNSTSQVALGLLNFVFPPLLAGKILVLIYLLLGAALAWWVSLQAHEALRGSVRLLVVMSIVLASGFWNGYLNYQLGLLLLAAFLWWVLKDKRPQSTDARRTLVIGAVGILAFFSHAIVFGGVVLIVAACAAIWRSPKQLLALLPAFGLTLWYLTGLLTGSGEKHGLPVVWLDGPIEAIQYKIYTAGKWGPFINFYAGLKSSMLQEVPVIYWIGVGLNIAFGAFSIGFLAWVSARKVARFWNAAPVATVTAVVCILGFVLMPFSMFLGVVNFGERLLGIGLVAVLIGLVVNFTPRSIVPIRTLALIALCGVPYLIIPACTLTPRDTGEPVWADSTDYYSEQRFYSTRPYQFLGKVRLLAAPGVASKIPDLGFETSVLVNRPR